MKDVVYSIPLEEMADRVYKAQNESLEDRSDEYLLNSNLWTDSEHVMANLCLNMDDARTLGFDRVIGVMNDGVGVIEWYAVNGCANSERGEDFKLRFAREGGFVLFSLIKNTDRVGLTYHESVSKF